LFGESYLSNFSDYFGTKILFEFDLAMIWSNSYK
jgi:hypothetical protein